MCSMSPTKNLSQDQVLLHPAGVLIQSLALGLTTSGLHPYKPVSHLHSLVGLPIKKVDHIIIIIFIRTTFGAANSCTLQSVDRL